MCLLQQVARHLYPARTTTARHLCLQTLIAGSDYNTTTANTIGGLTALTASDVVEVMVYDVFSVANLSSYFTTARVPFFRYDSTVKNIPLSADQKVPFTRFDATSSDFSLTN